METTKQDCRIATKSSFLPVLLPVLILATVACAARGVQEITQSHRPVHSTFTSRLANPTEATFLGYKRVEELSAKNEPGALALLQTLVEAPLSISGNTFHSKKLASFSPQSLLLGMVHSSLTRAYAAAERGDVETAHIYRESLRQIGDRLLSDSAPSVAVIQTAYRFHSAAARIQARLSGNDSQYEETMLRDVWQSRFAPLIESHTPNANAEHEARFAAQIAREYQEVCSRIRAGEA